MFGHAVSVGNQLNLSTHSSRTGALGVIGLSGSKDGSRRTESAKRRLMSMEQNLGRLWRRNNT